jgi:hypothetical protein
MVACSRPGSGWEYFSSLRRPYLVCSHTTSYSMDTTVRSPGNTSAGAWGLECDHSSPSIAEVINACIYTFTPPVGLHGLVLS